MLSALLFVSLVSAIPAECHQSFDLRHGLEVVANTQKVKNDLLKLKATSTQILRIVGVAKSKIDGAFLYCEFHFEDSQQRDKRIVEYWKNEILIAEKELDYSTGKVQPQVSQLDYRTGELRKTQFEKQWILTYKENKHSSLQESSLDADEQLVIDAGFDYFVKEQWSKLIDSESLKFDFASIPHLRSIRLRAERVTNSYCADATSDEYCLAVGAANRLLSLFVGKLYLTYDMTRRLKVFSGAVNLTDDKGETLDANIFYTHIE